MTASEEESAPATRQQLGASWAMVTAFVTAENLRVIPRGTIRFVIEDRPGLDLYVVPRDLAGLERLAQVVEELRELWSH